jgi:hypothetical protein
VAAQGDEEDGASCHSNGTEVTTRRRLESVTLPPHDPHIGEPGDRAPLPTASQTVTVTVEAAGGVVTLALAVAVGKEVVAGADFGTAAFLACFNTPSHDRSCFRYLKKTSCEWSFFMP